MSLLALDLEYLRVGWQKALDSGMCGNLPGTCIYIYRHGKVLVARTSPLKNNGYTLIETLVKTTDTIEPPAFDAKGRNAPADYGVNYEDTGKVI